MVGSLSPGPSLPERELLGRAGGGWRRAVGASLPGRRIATTICQRFSAFDHFPVAMTCCCIVLPLPAIFGEG